MAGLQAQVKAAKAMMQGGDHRGCLEACSKLLQAHEGELQSADKEKMLSGVHMLRGLAATKCGEWAAGVESFEVFTRLQPELPQGWKGLAECLEGLDKKSSELVAPWTHLAEIAEAKANWTRARGVRLKVARLLQDELGRGEEALASLHVLAETPGAWEEALSLSSSEEGAPEEGRLEAAEFRLRLVGLEWEGIKTLLDSAAEGKDAACAAAFFGREILGSDRDAVLQQFADGLVADLRSLEPPPGHGSEGGWEGLRRAADGAAQALFERSLWKVASGAAGDKEGPWREMYSTCRELWGAPLFAGRPNAAARGMLLASSYVPLAPPAARDDGDSTTEQLRGIATICAEASTCSGQQELVVRREGLLWLSYQALQAGQLAEAASIANQAIQEEAAPKVKAAGEAVTLGKQEEEGAAAHVHVAEELLAWRLPCLRCLVAVRKDFRGLSHSTMADELCAASSKAHAASRLLGRPDQGSGSCAGGGAGGGDGSPWDCADVLDIARAGLLQRLQRHVEAEALLSEVMSCLQRCCEREGTVIDEAQSQVVPLQEEWGRRLRSHAKCATAEGLLTTAAAGGAARAQAKAIYDEVLEEDGDCLWALRGLIALQLRGKGGKQEEEAEEETKAVVIALRPLVERAVALCEGATDDPLGRSNTFLLQARCSWVVEREQSFAQLLRAAKLDPANADAFDWLGRWYKGSGGDMVRAKGCWQRSLKISPGHSEAGLRLAALYVEQGQLALAKELFRSCAEESSLWEGHWAWVRLGRLAMAEDKLLEASEMLQQAIRGRPKAWSYWADLGWVYHTQSKRHAALKAYGRSQQLLQQLQEEEEEEDEDGGGEGGRKEGGEGKGGTFKGLLRVSSELGTVQRELGLCLESADSFDAALAVDGTNALALQGAAETQLALAHSSATEGLYSAAAAGLVRGVAFAERLLLHSSASAAFCCTWKTKGDLHTYAHRLPPSCFSEGGVEEQLAFVALGEEAYEKAFELSEEEHRPAALYDVGLNRYLRCQLLRQSLGEGSGTWAAGVYSRLPQVVALNGRAVRAFEACLKLTPLDSNAWNGLGLVRCDNALVQQHCFVRAIQIDHNPSAWANLAMLYIAFDLEDQAYEALGGLQSICDHPAMWVGLAMLKHRTASRALGLLPPFRTLRSSSSSNGAAGGEEEQEGCVSSSKGKRFLDQASDAYYSALETMQHPDALLGLGSATATVSWRQGGTGGGNNDSDGIVALQQYVELNPCNAAAWNALGGLLERTADEKGARRACRCYERAIALLEQQRRDVGAAGGGGGEAEAGSAEHKGDERCTAALRIAHANLGRARLLSSESRGAEAKEEETPAAAVSAIAALDKSGENADRLVHALALAAAGRSEDARAAFSGLVGMSGTPKGAPASGLGGALLCAAVATHRDGDTAAALKAAAEAVRQAPTHPKVAEHALALAGVGNDIALAKTCMGCIKQLDKGGASAAAHRGLVGEVLRASKAPRGMVRRALLTAVHRDPASAAGWLQLSAALLDDAARDSRSLGGEGRDMAEAEAVRHAGKAADSAFAMVRYSMLSLSIASRGRKGNTIDLHKAGAVAESTCAARGGGAFRGDAGDAAVSLTLKVAADAMEGGSSGNSRLVRSLSAALHMNPTDERSWRLLALLEGERGTLGEATAASAAAFGTAAKVHAFLAREGGFEGEASFQPAVDKLSQSWALLGQVQQQKEKAEGGEAGPGEEAGQTETLSRAREAVAQGFDVSGEEGGDDGDRRRALVKLAEARCHTAQEKQSEAVRAYKEAAVLCPRLAACWHELSACYQRLGKAHAALAALQCGIDALGGDATPDPSAVILHLEMGRLLCKAGRLGEAQAAVGRACRWQEVPAGEVLKGVIWLKKGQQKKATEAFERAIALDRSLAPAVQQILDKSDTLPT